jgi:hypothetical protein
MVLTELGRAMREMVERGQAYAAARRTLATAKAEYERAMSRELVKLRDSYRQSGERLPSEEMRRAICHQEITDEYPLLLAAEAECDAMERLLRVDQTRCSGLQSELRFLQQTELM